MRVLLAAIFVFGAMLGTVGLVHSYYPSDPVPWWAKLAPGAALLLALLASLVLFNRAGFRPSLRRRSLEEQIADLDAKGLVLRQPFEARRAFCVSEFEDEGPHYFAELLDGRVLYLNGQYLYDYGPIEDDPELSQPRAFPCTKFEVLRHKAAGYAIHVVCAGQVLEPEVMAEPFTRQTLRNGVPEDGQVFEAGSYEQLRRQFAAA